MWQIWTQGTGCVCLRFARTAQGGLERALPAAAGGAESPLCQGLLFGCALEQEASGCRLHEVSKDPTLAVMEQKALEKKKS